MNKVVHYDAGKIHMPASQVFTEAACGYWIAKIKKTRTRRTKNIGRVTCKNCLKRLGIKPQEVDEQKAGFARLIFVMSESGIVPDGFEFTVDQAEQYLKQIKAGAGRGE